MVKKTREFHDNKSENISGESIGGAALIRGRRLLTSLSQMRRLIEGGAYSSKYGSYLNSISWARKTNFPKLTHPEFLQADKMRDVFYPLYPVGC